MQENFTNEAIDIAALPKFEEVRLSPLHPDYWKVILINIGIVYGIIAIAAAAAAAYFIEETRDYLPIAGIAFVIIVGITVVVSRIRFKNCGFAFRTHDVIYRSGAIAITTTIIPYNRVQHVALHEGPISRKLDLAAIEIFTAGGLSSDIKIPGLEKEEAERIKQLLMGKVLKKEENGE